MTVPGSREATGNLVEWSASEQWAPLHREVFEAHFDPFAGMIDAPADDIAEILSDAFDMPEMFIVEDFFAARFGGDGETNVVDDYLRRRGWRETAAAKRYLQGLRDSAVSLYEVTGIDPGRGLTVRDLLLGGRAVAVEEKLGSREAAPWHRLAARVVEMDGKSYFTGGILAFDRELSQLVPSGFEELFRKVERDLRREARRWGVKPPPRPAMREMTMRELPCARLLSEYWLGDAVLRAAAPPPELRNTDGDALEFCEVRFPVAGNTAKVAAALDAIGDFEREAGGEPRWRWVAPGSPSHRLAEPRTEGEVLEREDEIGARPPGYAELGTAALTLAVDSRERAERGRDLLASGLGGLVGPPLVSHQDPEMALEEHAGQAPEEPVIPTAEATETMHGWLDGHYRRTLDEPLPVLDGVTPRAAAATRSERKRAIEWLKKVENGEHRRAAPLGHEPYDTSWL